MSWVSTALGWLGDHVQVNSNPRPPSTWGTFPTNTGGYYTDGPPLGSAPPASASSSLLPLAVVAVVVFLIARKGG